MSRVFVAHDRSLGRMVAIKVLSPEVAAELKTERFRLEIQLAAKLQHPHIVPLLFAGENRGILYFTMPFIEGESLRARIGREGQLPLNDATRTLRQIASALAYAHRQGVVHRDIKPDNVLLAGEFALVTDFGVAKALTASTTAGGGPQNITSGGMAIGTPAYMAPEQALADPGIDHRADIYAFGAVAYEILTGSPPFRMKTAQATLAAHVTKQPEPIQEKRPDIPHDLANLVMRCLAKRPDERPSTADELCQVFDSLVTGSAISGERVVAVPPRGSYRRRIIAAVVTVLLAIGVWYALSARAPGVSASTANLNSIAVLPLQNIGPEKADEYFSDGMTDELAGALSKLPGLRVASRTSAYSFKGTKADVGEIGRKLNVQAVIEGTVRRSGDRIRVSAQLTRVADGIVVWREDYEHPSGDVFTIQDQIARSIAEAVRPRLGAQTRNMAADVRGTSNPQAHDLYLRGRYLWNARGADNLRLAISYFDQAIAKDPQFARAYAARAIAYALLPEYTDKAPADASARTNAAAQKALSLDPSLAEANTAMGLAGVHDWRFDEAERSYRRALELDPQYPTAHQWFAELLYHTGRVDSSLVELRRARELDPLAPILPSAIGYALYLNRRYDDAIAELSKGIELAPTLGLHRVMLGTVYLAKGQYGEAIREIQRAATLEPELAIRQGFLAYAYGKSGNDRRAAAIVERLEASSRADRPPAVALAVAYLGMGENDKALTALERAVAVRDISLLSSVSAVLDPILDPLRSDPRFRVLLEKMNLSRYAAPGPS